MLCPYSLTLPGGVQMQVLGLARAVRRQGHDVRVLAPCDGPPPEVGEVAGRLDPLVRSRWHAGAFAPRLAGPYRSPVTFEAWPPEP